MRIPAVPLPGILPDETQSFILTAVVVEGATVFGPEDFAPLYEDQLARETTLADVEAIVGRITALYQDAGYILSRAVAMPQDLPSGVLTIKVIEGYIETVSFEGDAANGEFSSYIERLRADRPLSKATLERNILLINDLPGVTVSASLNPLDEAEGRYELILTIKRDPVDGTVYLDNRGTPAVGRLQTWLSAGLNDTLGLDERIEGGFFTVPNEPDELQYIQLTYSQPIGNQGTDASVTLSQSWISPSDDLDNTESEATSASFRLGHPLIRTRDESLWINGIFDYRDSEQESFGATVFDDRLRVLRGRANYSLSDGLSGTNYVQFQVSQGLPILDASRASSTELSRLDGHSRFTKLNASVTRQQEITETIGLQLSAAGQWSSDALLSSEEFAVGGTPYGRAYDFGELTGDQGLAASVELRFGRNLDGELLRAFQFYGFYDFGAVWNDRPGGGLTRDSLASAGGGVRLRLTEWVFATFELAKPLTRRVANTGDTSPRLFFSLSSSF